MRLNAYLARAGVASRRGAEELIRAGRVRVNGEVAGLATFVEASDRVELDGRLLAPEPLPARLRELAQSLGVSERVSIEAPVHGDDKWALLAGALVLGVAAARRYEEQRAERDGERAQPPVGAWCLDFHSSYGIP